LAFRRVPEEQVLARESADEFFDTYSRCLSQFENNILRLYLSGHSYRAIAEATGRSVKSVDNAVQRIRRKLARQTNLGEFSKG
jgi:RNA polymerase sporulation-specific sigma factor